MTKLVIVLEGGLVQTVCSDNPDAFKDVEIMTIDYDTDGADEDEITHVKQTDDSWAEAIVIDRDVDQSTLPFEFMSAADMAAADAEE